MKHSLQVFSAVLVFCASCASTNNAEVVAQEPLDMEAAMALAAPGPEHELFAKLAGDWTMTSTMWMTPDATPVVATAAATNELVLGGRFLQTHTTGEMKIDEYAIEIESLGMLGFDRRNKAFTTVGFDTMGTYYVTATGQRDAATGVITMEGSDQDQQSGITQTYKFVMRVIDDDHYVVDLYFTNPEFTHGQAEFHLVEMSYARN